MSVANVRKVAVMNFQEKSLTGAKTRVNRYKCFFLRRMSLITDQYKKKLRKFLQIVCRVLSINVKKNSSNGRGDMGENINWSSLKVALIIDRWQPNV